MTSHPVYEPEGLPFFASTPPEQTVGVMLGHGAVIILLLLVWAFFGH